jgi:AmmeMemoRadiSam system protein B
MRFILSFVLVVAVASVAVAESGVVRLCVSAGKLFPESEAELRATVTRLLDGAKAPVPNEPLVACVVPHGPYGISGHVAAEAFKHLQRGQFKRVIVLGASHADMDFEDCSIDAVDAYATPLGFVALDKVAVRTLTYSTLFATRSLRYNHEQKGFLSESERKPLHEYEHSIELVLPFLQERLGKFELVPILVGQLTNATGSFSEKRAEAVATQIKRIMDSETLLVVSTDFTHFGNDFSYRPFENDIPNKIEKLDKEGLSRLASNDFASFEDFIHQTKDPICGLNALRVMQKLLPANAYGTLLARDTSGRFYNDENRSVSYASMNFYLSSVPRPMRMPEPLNATPLAPPTAAPEANTSASDVAPAAPESGTESAPTDGATATTPQAERSGPRPAPVNLTNIRREPVE